MFETHSFSHPMHQRENGIQNKCQFRNTKLKKKKINENIKPNIAKETNNEYLLM